MGILYKSLCIYCFDKGALVYWSRSASVCLSGVKVRER